MARAFEAARLIHQLVTLPASGLKVEKYNSQTTLIKFLIYKENKRRCQFAVTSRIPKHTHN